jgi:uncharacterized membrane protein
MYNGILIFLFIFLNIPLLILVPVQKRRLKKASKIYRFDVISLILMVCSAYMLFQVIMFFYDGDSAYPHLILIMVYGIIYFILSIYWFMKIWNSKNKSGINNKREDEK